MKLFIEFSVSQSCWNFTALMKHTENVRLFNNCILLSKLNQVCLIFSSDFLCSLILIVRGSLAKFNQMLRSQTCLALCRSSRRWWLKKKEEEKENYKIKEEDEGDARKQVLFRRASRCVPASRFNCHFKQMNALWFAVNWSFEVLFY